MGMIVIDVRGSFPSCGVHNETALEGGHAAALGRAIAHLTAMLPAAIARDHELHTSGDTPPNAKWGEKNPPPNMEGGTYSFWFADLRRELELRGVVYSSPSEVLWLEREAIDYWETDCLSPADAADKLARL